MKCKSCNQWEKEAAAENMGYCPICESFTNGNELGICCKIGTFIGEHFIRYSGPISEGG